MPSESPLLSNLPEPAREEFRELCRPIHQAVERAEDEANDIEEFLHLLNQYADLDRLRVLGDFLERIDAFQAQDHVQPWTIKEIGGFYRVRLRVEGEVRQFLVEADTRQEVEEFAQEKRQELVGDING